MNLDCKKSSYSELFFFFSRFLRFNRSSNAAGRAIRRGTPSNNKKRMLYDGLSQPINGRNHGVLTSPAKDRKKRAPPGDV